MAVIIPRSGRLLGTIIPDLVIEESTNDSYEITAFPVQQGANISDHKYKKPTVLKMEICFEGASQSDLAQKYQALLDLQASDSFFDVTTPKRLYKNMLIKSLGVTTDKQTENILKVSAEMQEVVITSVVITSVPPRANQKDASRTGATQNAGSKNANDESNTKRKSALTTLISAFK